MTNSRMRTMLIGLTATAALGVLGGCGSSSSTGTAAGSSGSAVNSASSSSAVSTGSSPSSSAAVIVIKDFAYQSPASVSPGAKVTVMNMDRLTHTVTADSGGAFDTSIDPGATSTFTAPMKPGSYPFHCTYHASMHGTLVVK